MKFKALKLSLIKIFFLFANFAVCGWEKNDILDANNNPVVRKIFSTTCCYKK